MAEHKRTTDSAGTVYQWVDADRCMVLDAVTGQPERFGAHGEAVATLEEALSFCAMRPGWEKRMVIARLSCVVGCKVEQPA